jgi:lysophospholipase L1-like esterase
MRLFAIICALALASTDAHAAGTRWIGSWAAAPAMPMAAPASNPARGTPTFDNQTIVQVLRLSAGGQRLRLRLSNEYGAQPLAIDAARVALVDAQGAVVPGSDRPVTFGGGKRASLPAGAPLISDPVALQTKPLARVRVSLFLPSDTHGCTCHMTGAERVQVLPGDWSDRTPPPLPPPPATTNPALPATEYRAFLSGVEVETTVAAASVVAAFGDSITDGYRSTTGADHRWPDRLAERLVAASKGRPIAVTNTGISGNRVLSDGVIPIFGQSALSRFDRDVLSIPGVTHVVVLEGVNDLGGKPSPSAEQLIAGYRQLIARAHAHGLKIIGATILPYGGAAYYAAAADVERGKVNTWMRTSHDFDGVVDLDAAMRDPAHPERMKAELQSGDWLHPNDAGYRVMGDAVDLALFR